MRLKLHDTVHTLRGGALVSIVVLISCISHLTFHGNAPQAAHVFQMLIIVGPLSKG